MNSEQAFHDILSKNPISLGERQYSGGALGTLGGRNPLIRVNAELLSLLAPPGFKNPRVWDSESHSVGSDRAPTYWEP